MQPRWCMNLWRHGVPAMRNFSDTLADSGASSHAALMNSQLDPALGWDIIAWLRDRWRGPILIEGVLSSEDALQAVAHGIDGIIVSNHGAASWMAYAHQSPLWSGSRRASVRRFPYFSTVGCASAAMWSGRLRSARGASGAASRS